MKVTYEDLLNDPSLIDRIHAAAHRERAKAVNQLLVQPLKRLVSDAPAHPHLARQG